MTDDDDTPAGTARREAAARRWLVLDAQSAKDLLQTEDAWVAEIQAHLYAQSIPEKHRHATIEAIAALVWRGMLG